MYITETKKINCTNIMGNDGANAKNWSDRRQRQRSRSGNWHEVEPALLESAPVRHG